MDNLVQFEEDFNSRTKEGVGTGGDGYLRPDQFLDHLTVIIMMMTIILMMMIIILRMRTIVKMTIMVARMNNHHHYLLAPAITIMITCHEDDSQM